MLDPFKETFQNKKRRKKAKKSNPWPLDSEVIALPLCCLQTSALSQFSLVWMVLKHNSKSYFVERHQTANVQKTNRIEPNQPNLAPFLSFSLFISLSLPPSLSFLSRSLNLFLPPSLSLQLSQLESAKRVEQIITATWTCLAFQWPST